MGKDVLMPTKIVLNILVILPLVLILPVMFQLQPELNVGKVKVEIALLEYVVTQLQWLMILIAEIS